MRGAGDEAISCNKEQIATLTLAMTINVDTTILQSCDVGCLWLQDIINSAHGNAMWERYTTKPAPHRSELQDDE
ncbi:MAG: hypothetical protein ACK5IQ_05905 [Bacteroidales bacterium]